MSPADREPMSEAVGQHFCLETSGFHLAKHFWGSEQGPWGGPCPPAHMLRPAPND